MASDVFTFCLEHVALRGDRGCLQSDLEAAVVSAATPRQTNPSFQQAVAKLKLHRHISVTTIATTGDEGAILFKASDALQRRVLGMSLSPASTLQSVSQGKIERAILGAVGRARSSGMSMEHLRRELCETQSANHGSSVATGSGPFVVGDVDVVVQRLISTKLLVQHIVPSDSGEAVAPTAVSE